MIAQQLKGKERTSCVRSCLIYGSQTRLTNMEQTKLDRKEVTKIRLKEKNHKLELNAQRRALYASAYRALVTLTFDLLTPNLKHHPRPKIH